MRKKVKYKRKVTPGENRSFKVEENVLKYNIFRRVLDDASTKQES